MSLQLVLVTRRFGSQRALDGVSLHVRRGECYGLLGPNGAGKTTALRVLLGLLRPHAGQVLVDGFDAARHPTEARARLGALAEFPSFYDGLGGRRNLLLLARLSGLDAATARTEADRVLAITGLAPAAGKPVRAYSQGMRRRLGLALSLLGRRRHLVLDEPMNGLDPEGIAEFREILRRINREEGLSILLSSHLLSEVSELCTRIGVMRQGKLIVEEETALLLHDERGRYRLLTDDPEAAMAVLQATGIEAGREDGALLLDLHGRPPADVARHLVLAGREVRAFEREPRTLEEIYLAAAQGTAAVTPPSPPEPGAGPLPERVAPGFGWLRALRFELQRACLRPSGAMILAAPAALGALAVWHRSEQAGVQASEVAAAAVFSATDVTAFEGVAVALGTGLPLALVLAAGAASQSVAGDLGRGTLRNILLCPLRRFDAAAGKIAAILLQTVLSYGLLVAAALAASAWFFDFGDLTEILPNGKRFPLLAADHVWPELRRALVAPLLPLGAFAAIGFLAGAAARQAASALAFALGAVLVLDLGRALARPHGFEAWLPSSYLPSPLGDRSFLQYYTDVSKGFGDAFYRFAGTDVLVPGLWALASLFLATMLILRRSVP